MFSILNSFLLDDPGASAVTALLSEFTLKSTLLLGLGLALSSGWRRGSAALRFRILWLTALAVPVFLITSFVGVSRNSTPGLVLTLPELPVPEAGSSANPVPAPSVSGNSMGAPFITSESATGSARYPDGILLLALVWLAGILAGGLRMGFHRWRLSRRTRHCWSRVTHGALHESLTEVARTAGLKTVPRLFLSQSWIMPATWGWRKPAVVLPAETEKWEPSRRRHVLTHECGHIARRDALTHSAATLALTLIWFHPLAWLTRRQLAALREAACDDWVVTCGKADPLAYMTDLLALVKQHFGRKPRRMDPLRIGMAMARSSSIGTRLRRLLADGVNRSRPPRAVTGGIILGWLFLVGGVSILVSCRTAMPPENAPMAGITVGENHVATSLSPEKPRAGAAKLDFAILEISIPQGTEHFLTPWLPPASPGTPPLSGPAFESLRTASMTRGVDLMSAPETAEGQKLVFRVWRNHRYPIEFESSGRPLAYEVKEAGVRLTVTGEKILKGTFIEADVDLKITEKEEDKAYPLANGTVITQPCFRTRHYRMKSLRIPNGGFTVISGWAQEDRRTDPVTGPVTRCLAIGVSSDPLPPAAAGVNPPKPVIIP